MDIRRLRIIFGALTVLHMNLLSLGYLLFLKCICIITRFEFSRYLGRKPMQKSEEELLPGTKYLSKPGYSYWTLGYVLSYEGAKKLIDSDPLSKLLPVDEYLPIMFDKHPNTDWKMHYEPRNLVALSAEALLLYPTHYTYQKGYISDTEDSLIVNLDKEEL